MAPVAPAAPPANDTPAAPGAFEPYTAANGIPDELQAIAELAEAGRDRSEERCLGSDSFARTAWYRIPGAEVMQEIRVEASGRTLEVVDLAAYVQAPFDETPLTARPNACAGKGAGGSDLSADRTAGLTLRVPPFRSVLLQVGRRGPSGAPDDEQALLSLVQRPLEGLGAPPGDEANFDAPRVRPNRPADVPLGGATTTAEDPATPACASMAGVWRLVKVPRKPRRGRWTITVGGAQAAGLGVFAGRRVRPGGFRGCVDRDGDGPIVLPVRARRKQLLWIRVATDRAPADAQARIRFERAGVGDVESGGGCLAALAPRISGRLAEGPASAKRRNRSRRLPLRLGVRGGPVCSARLELVGPRGLIYASGSVGILRGGAQLVGLRRVRRLVRGRYRLRVEAAAPGGVRANVPTSLSFRLSR
jgi:hypothetical protein